MPDRELPARPNLEQYKKQAKELVREAALGTAAALARIRRQNPRLRFIAESQPREIKLTDAQLVIAREHGYDSWPSFARHVETLRMIRSLEDLPDPVSAFIEFACVDRHGWHGGGTVENAELIRARYPQVAAANIFAAAVTADERAVRGFVAADPALASAPGGPHGWDALTYLCFSRYLRIDKSRSDAFVATARCLLEAGASANTGWTESIDDPPRPIQEKAIYGAAGVAHHPELTRLLLDYGADPNDEETPYHVPETYDNAVLRVLLDCGRLNERSLATIAARKSDWHDEKGLKLALDAGANPNFVSQWKYTPFQHAIRRDNGLVMIEMLLDHGADPYLRTAGDQRNAFQMAAYHGRGDVLAEFERRRFAPDYEGPTATLDALVAACARGEKQRVQALVAGNADLREQVLEIGGSLLARFAGAANLEGIRILLDLGIPVDALWPDGDPYFELARNSTALHVAAWRAHHDIVRELIARGADVNAKDPRGRTPLQFAVRACIDSYWKYRRKPDSVAALLAAGATTDGVEIPAGYEAIDELLRGAEA